MESEKVDGLTKTLKTNIEEVKPKNKLKVAILPSISHSEDHPGHKEGDSFDKWGVEAEVELGGKIYTGARCEVSWGAKGSASRNSGIPPDERYAVDPEATPEHGYAVTATGEVKIQCAIKEGGKKLFITGRGGVIKPNSSYAPGLTAGPGLLWKPSEELEISGEALVSPAIVDIGKGDVGGGAGAAVPIQIKLKKPIVGGSEISGQAGVVFSDAGENNAGKNVPEYISPSLKAELLLKAAENFKLTLGGGVGGHFNREGGPDTTILSLALGGSYKRFGLGYEYQRVVAGGEVTPTGDVCGISVCPENSLTADSRSPAHIVTASYELTNRLKLLAGIQSGANELVRKNDFGETTEPNGSSWNLRLGVEWDF